MDRKKLLLIAAAGILVSGRMTTTSNAGQKIDSALDEVRQNVRSEQPLAVDADGEQGSDELFARMY